MEYPDNLTIKKRSVNINGHKTSVSVEEPFWDHLRTMAERKRVSVGDCVALIDAARKTPNLSSAIRLAVFEDAKATVAK